MTIIQKLIKGVVIALLCMVVPGFTHASDHALELQAKITALRTVHAELKAQVNAGDLRKEDAQEKWKEHLADFRAEKEKYFQDKIQRVKEKYQEFAQAHPQRAELVKERIDASLKVRAQIAKDRAQIRAQVQAGELSHKDALEAKKEVMKEKHSLLRELRQDIHQKRKSHTPNNDSTSLEFDSSSTTFPEIVNQEKKEKKAARPEKKNTKTHPGFDPTGLKALEIFPDVKAELDASAHLRTTQETQALSERKNEQRAVRNLPEATKLQKTHKNL